MDGETWQESAMRKLARQQGGGAMLDRVILLIEARHESGYDCAPWVLVKELRKLAVEPAEAPLYRFLVEGDVIRQGDEFVDDDCVTWNPPDRWSIGRSYHSGFKTARRKVARGVSRPAAPLVSEPAVTAFSCHQEGHPALTGDKGERYPACKKWCGSRELCPASLGAEMAEVMGMTEPELDAALLAEGIDPEQAAESGKRAVSDALRRYDMGFFKGAPAMFEQPEGAYVKYEDAVQVDAPLPPTNEKTPAPAALPLLPEDRKLLVHAQQAINMALQGALLYSSHGIVPVLREVEEKLFARLSNQPPKD